MTVVPCHSPIIRDRHHLHQFLTHQQQWIEHTASALVSLVLEIDPVDPLAVLQRLGKERQPHFYLEKAIEGEAIAAMGATLALHVNGSDRFLKTQHFVKSSLEKLTPSCFIAPKFFCSFTFFDQPLFDQPSFEQPSFKDLNQSTQTCSPQMILSTSPFAAATIFLPRWQVMRRSDSCQLTLNLTLTPTADIDQLTASIWRKLELIQSAKLAPLDWPEDIRRHLSQWDIRDTNQFSTRVGSALDTIRQHHLNKIVLAHAIDVASRLPFQAIRSLFNLRQLHPDCYIFSTGTGNGYHFIGASPERLVSIRNQELVTDALAGSAPRGKTISQDMTLAKRLFESEKERREHQIVVDFIAQRLRLLGVFPQFAPRPSLLKLPNIQHLHTPIRATLPVTLHPLTILSELHPTPAVAGIPRELACQYIRRYEPFERSLYAAPLGWVDAQGDAEFIVGIRSALIAGTQARLYAGAGIVEGSDPERERAEVHLKLQALLHALR